MNIFSTLQRAMDLYKKQSVKLPNGAEGDIVAESNRMQVDEPVPIPSSENREVSVSASDGAKDVLIPKVEPKKEEIHVEEINQTSSQMDQDYDCTHSLETGMSSPSSGHENQEAIAGFCEKEDKVTSDKAHSGDAEENQSMASKNGAQLATTLHEDGDDMSSEAKTTGSAHCADEKLGFDDTKVNPLIFEDGSPKACDALIPGSNESESLILSRIHHSPESTH